MTQATERLGAALDRKLSRRGLLGRLALAGTAFSVAPLRYLLRPQPAWAIIRPERCAGGLCADGYTAFCCEIAKDQGNTCPSGTYVAGWWKCTDYRGAGLCHDEGVRYYLDCNRHPDATWPGGCECAGGTCSKRRVDCNRFRYGQCNTQVYGTTEVVCRVVVCEHPAQIPEFNCNRTEKVDDSVCGHDVACLTPLVVQLPGSGGV
jgi:hypothetical protein